MITLDSVMSEILYPSILFGILIGCSVFFLGLGINLCFKLFKS